jgi:glycolate oxidase
MEILKICADLGGTISGEHGIGTEKLKGMDLVFRGADLEMMQSLKTAIDSKGVCNPGKVIPRA